LTGDFNPIHWVPAYAKMAGFKTTILHGFATLALAWESVVQAECGGDPAKMAWMDVRFVRPQLLPGEAVVAIGEGKSIAVGAGIGERATMLGTYGTRKAPTPKQAAAKKTKKKGHKS
jgi:acyl dehydratase